jgi:soluble lytic murein transglycosylase-like protein
VKFRHPVAALIAVTPLVLAATPANAALPHLVRPGETLWSIAAANNLTTRTVAAYNGLSVDSAVVAGRTIMVPTVAQGAAALAGTAPASPAAQTGTESSEVSEAGESAPPPQGAYIVRPGDTLSAIAARSGVSAAQIAWMNGLSVDGPLLAGTPLKLPTGSPLANREPATRAAVQTPVGGVAPRPAVVPRATPYATPGRTTSGQIGQIAAANGVPPSLAAAIGWQESGFNNSMVSSANARGVMQVMPGTWNWIQRNLVGAPLDPASTTDNVRAGVLYLHQLLRDSGGDPSLAVAGYYQGLGSVKRVGMLPETQRYVANVMALRSRFGGP